eukprot:m.83851 g.83851  ORF g.83851 m.83851 type:complete len:614 (+) comp12730_c0_seq1:140-1981(+)
MEVTAMHHWEQLMRQVHEGEQDVTKQLQLHQKQLLLLEREHLGPLSSMNDDGMKGVAIEMHCEVAPAYTASLAATVGINDKLVQSLQHLSSSTLDANALSALLPPPKPAPTRHIPKKSNWTLPASLTLPFQLPPPPPPQIQVQPHPQHRMPASLVRSTTQPPTTHTRGPQYERRAPSPPTHRQSSGGRSRPSSRHYDEADQDPTQAQQRPRGAANFLTAAEQLQRDQAKNKKSLGGKRPGMTRPPQQRRSTTSAFVAPYRADEDQGDEPPRKMHSRQSRGSVGGGAGGSGGQTQRRPTGDGEDEQGAKFLQNVDAALVERIMSEIMEHSPNVSWDDIAGLEDAKRTIKELVIWPMQRPDLFRGLRSMPKGVLLFGPPGTGKTLIGKCIASQSNATFFSISASSLTSKWIGEGEKLVRALFAVARDNLPAVIFIDEIDSLLAQRSDTEHESSRRIKTEFLVQLDGATTSSEEQLLIVGATNRPQELDEAARRRLVRRMHIPLPDASARRQIVLNLLHTDAPGKGSSAVLSEADLDKITELTEGYSGSDMSYLCKEAALCPMRDIQDITRISSAEVRPIEMSDFIKALTQVRPSVSQKEVDSYKDWDMQFGSHST